MRLQKFQPIQIILCFTFLIFHLAGFCRYNSLSERESAVVRRNLSVRENFKAVFLQTPQTRFEQRDVLKTTAAQSDPVELFSLSKNQSETQN